MAESSNGRLDFAIGIDNRSLQSDVNRSKQLLGSISDRAEQEGQRMDETFKKVGASVAGIFAADKIKDFIVNVAKVRGEFQQLEMSFKTLLQSADKADALLAQLVQTAIITPFQLTDISSAAKQLLAYGVAADEVNETLMRLGDIAAGLSVPMGDLAYLYGTTLTQGRLYTQDLRQFTGRGIPLVEELANQFGVTKEQVSKLVTEGKVGFPEVKKAIISLTSEGSKFGGLMEAQSKTIAGRISNLQDAFELMINDIGKQSEGVISGAIGVAASLVENYEKVGRILATLITTYGAYKAAVIALSVAEKVRYQATLAQMAGMTKMQAIMDVLRAKTEALNTAMASNKYLLLAAAVAALTVGTVKLVKAQKEAKNTQILLNEAASEGAKSAAAQTLLSKSILEVNKNIATERVQIDTLFAKLRSATEGTDAYQTAKQAIIDQYGNYLKGLGDEITSLNDVKGAYDAITTSAIKAAKARMGASAAQTAAETYAEAEAKAYEQIDKLIQRKFKGQTGEGGMSLATLYSTQVLSALSRGEAVPSDILDRFNEINLVGGEQTTRNTLQPYINAITKAKATYDATLEAINIKFGEIATGEATTPATLAETSATDPDEAAKIAEAIRKRTQQIAEYGDEIAKAERQAELDARQAKIDGMAEGLQKEMEQNRLDYDTLLADIEDRQNEYIKAYRANLLREWQNANPTATDSQINAKEDELAQTIGAEQLPQSLKDIITTYSAIAAQSFTTANENSLKDALEQFRTYEQRRAAISEEYARKRAALYNADGTLKEGVTAGNVDELNYNEKEALRAIDEEFASREEAYEAWMNALSDQTLEQLKEVLAEAKRALEDATANGVGGTELATARAKVAKAEKEIAKAQAENETGETPKRTLKEWEDLYKVLNECNQEFEAIGETIGGMAGEAIKATGSITSSALSMISGIKQLALTSTAGVTTAATGAAKAIKTVERASVILTVISAAMEIATQIASLFNSDDSKANYIDSLQTRIDQLQWELDNADIIRLQQNWGDALTKVSETYQAIYNEAMRAVTAQGKMEGINAILTKVKVKQDIVATSAEKLAKAYANIEYTADKALGSGRYDTAKEQLQNYSQQQILLYQQLEAAKSKKKTDKDEIAEIEQKIEEAAQSANDVLNTMVEDIIGGSATDIAEELGEAFFEAFAEGEDAAEAWGEKVNDIVADIVKNMLVQELLEKPLGEIFNKYKSKWFGSDGTFAGFSAVNDSLPTLANEINAYASTLKAGMEALSPELQALLNSTTNNAREAVSKGIATASQESVDELNGRMTAVQGHTYSINESIKAMREIGTSMLSVLYNIDHNTSRLSSIEADMHTVSNTVNDIALKGVKIK